MALRTRTLFAAGGAVLVSVALTGCGADASSAPVEHKSFPLSGKTLTIESDNSTIELVPADVKKVEVSRRVDGWVLVGSGPNASWSMKNDRLTLKLKCSGLVNNCEARHQIKVPRGVAVTVQDDNGSVTASGFDTALKLRSDNGKVTVKDSSGALDLHSDNGQINGDALSSRSISADSSNGQVRLSLAAVPDRVDSGSDNGSIRITLPKKPGVSYKVDARSHNGRVRVSVPKNDASGHTVRAHSSNGEVTVRSAN
ncbi:MULTISPECIES: DUF4097 family beta strand repeat-containing protein [unclassified Streptomyces]|uniref:DUF4097 family beta strand repeat-containing protein n=1 Tax=unclassified Streptomyces TaxID=2593676 RepID=UPI0027E4B55D|nr:MULTISPECIES: DUF4097 family beta strand repeat-containing protein [unclassified Streptomyces]